VVKVASKAASNALLSTQQQAAWCDITGISYARHEKPGKPASLRVTYECGLARHSEWVCFEHTGFPREKAVVWWLRRAGKLPAPSTVGEAIEQLDQLRRPIAIQVRPTGQYTEIAAARFV
jgi:DNA repair protein RadD